MRITFVLPFASLAGGIRVVAIYAEKLLARGHDVRVISQGRPAPSTARKLFQHLSRRRKSVKPPTVTTLLDFLGERHIVINKPFPLEPEIVPDADVIIATWWRTAFAVSALPPSKGKQFYFVQHHEVHRHLDWHLSRGSYFLPLQKITISQWLADTMRTDYDDPDVDIIENSVDLDLFYAPEREKNRIPTVGLLYSSKHMKGVDISLRAIEIARQRVPNLRLIAFGDQPEDPALPLPEGSEYYQSPEQNKLRKLYASCDVWLCGSRAEGFHLPPSEAMACRCPVVTSRIGGGVEIVTEGINGHIVDVEDAEALGARLADVALLDAAAWKAMSDAAYARAVSYSWDDATDKFERLLTKFMTA